MKKTLVAATVAALVGAGGTAYAADMYAGGGLKDVPVVAPAPAWTGFYIGGHLGAAWANFETDRQDFYGNTICEGGGWWWDTYYPLLCNTGHNSYGGDKLSSTGAFGGGQLGYNWQTTNWLLGIEVDLGGMAADGDHTFVTSATSVGPYSGIPYTSSLAVRVKSEGGFYGDVTGRLGYTWGPALLYAKGGFAWLEETLRVTGSYADDFGSGQKSHTFSDTLTGWTVGGGAEYMLNPNWTMKVEYLHFDFTNFDNTWNDSSVTNFKVTHGDLTIDTVKLGFNYLLNHGYTPLK